MYTYVAGVFTKKLELDYIKRQAKVICLHETKFSCDTDARVMGYEEDSIWG